MSEAPLSIGPFDVIFKPITVRGFWMGYPEFAAKILPAMKEAAAMIASWRGPLAGGCDVPALLDQASRRARPARRESPSGRRRMTERKRARRSSIGGDDSAAALAHVRCGDPGQPVMGSNVAEGVRAASPDRSLSQAMKSGPARCSGRCARPLPGAIARLLASSRPLS